MKFLIFAQLLVGFLTFIPWAFQRMNFPTNAMWVSNSAWSCVKVRLYNSSTLNAQWAVSGDTTIHMSPKVNSTQHRDCSYLNAMDTRMLETLAWHDYLQVEILQLWSISLSLLIAKLLRKSQSFCVTERVNHVNLRCNFRMDWYH